MKKVLFCLITGILFLDLLGLFMVPLKQMENILYGSFLLLLVLAGILAWSLHVSSRAWKQVQEQMEDGLWIEDTSGLNRRQTAEVLEHNLLLAAREQEVLHRQLQDLQDDVALWVHEMKLPLSALLLMNEQSRDEQARASLEKLRQQMDTLLAMSRLQQANRSWNFRQVQAGDLLKETVKNNSWQLIHHHFQLDLDAEEFVLCTDRQWFVYLLDQLVSNAVKYRSRTRTPCLRLKAWKQEDRFFFSLEDNGLGIAPEDLPRIFDKGYAGHNEATALYASTGLGLYLARSIADGLGLSVSCTSQEGEGTRFLLSLENDLPALVRLDLHPEEDALQRQDSTGLHRAGY